MVSSDPLVVIFASKCDLLDPLGRKILKKHIFLDPVKAAEAAQLKSLTGTLLKKVLAPSVAGGVQSDTPKPRAAGRSSGPPLSDLRRKPMTKEIKDQIKGGAAIRRSRFCSLTV